MRRVGTGLLLALLLALPACGGDDPADVEVVEAEAWAGTVCSEVGAAALDLRRALRVIDELPAEVAADAPLGDQAGPLRDAFLALPVYVNRFRAVVEATPAPDTADGAAFRDEVLADLAVAATTFEEAASAAESLSGDTTVQDFFGGAQAFAGFPAALDASDLDFGEDVPPGVQAALQADRTCVEVQDRLANLIGG